MKSSKLRRKKTAKEIVRVVAAYLIAFCFIAPFLYLIASSFKSSVDLQAWPPKFFFEPILDNYIKIFTDMDLGPYLLNSLIVSVVVTAVSILLGLPAAYALSRYRFRGQGAFANTFLIIQLAPAVAMILPFFLMANTFGLFNTRLWLMIAYMPWNIPYAIWMLRGYIITTPAAVEEAGMIDGCTRFQAFWKLTMPQLRPGLIATIIFTFIGSWNEFLLANFLTNTVQAQTFPTTVDFFLTYGNYQFGPMFAAAVIGTVPILAFALSVRKQYLTALTGGAVKG